MLWSIREIRCLMLAHTRKERFKHQKRFGMSNGLVQEQNARWDVESETRVSFSPLASILIILQWGKKNTAKAWNTWKSAPEFHVCAMPLGKVFDAVCIMFSVSFPTSLFRRPRLGTLLFKLSSCASQPAEWGVYMTFLMQMQGIDRNCSNALSERLRKEFSRAGFLEERQNSKQIGWSSRWSENEGSGPTMRVLQPPQPR